MNQVTTTKCPHNVIILVASVVVVPNVEHKPSRFPTEADVNFWGQSSNVQIEIPHTALLDNRDRGFSRIVFFTYNHLQQILQPLESPKINVQQFSMSIFWNQG